MDSPASEFVPILAYDTDSGHREPLEALQAWLREQGIASMPFDADDVRVIAPCGRDTNGNWDRSVIVRVRAVALHRLGLHPEEPTTPSETEL